jgi:hypothetical protein
VPEIFVLKIKLYEISELEGITIFLFVSKLGQQNGTDAGGLPVSKAATT